MNGVKQVAEMIFPESFGSSFGASEGVGSSDDVDDADLASGDGLSPLALRLRAGRFPGVGIVRGRAAVDMDGRL